MTSELRKLEKDFIEFVSNKKGQPLSDIERIYLYIKKRFDSFKGKKYETFSGNIQALYRIYYDIYDERSAVEAYQFFAHLHLIRFLSYSESKKVSNYIQETISLIKRGQFKNLFTYAYRKISGKSAKRSTTAPSGHIGIAKSLVDKTNNTPVVVDYGSGLGYTSFEIGKLNNKTKFFLVDIDCLVLEFTAYRFQKHGLDVETIPITTSNIYPELPTHNVCIATEVMEHLYQPLTAYKNIHDALEPGGQLYGNFDDHDKGVFHVSPDLSELRHKVQQDFETVDFRCYKKIK